MRIDAPVFGQLAALADATRCRLLFLLEQQPLSVGEACSVMQLPQSTVSRHLKVLLEEGWVKARAQGPSRLYRLAKLAAPAQRIWDTVRTEVGRSAAVQQDQQRLGAVLEVRRGRAAAFFSAAAGEWERMRRELFGPQADLLPLLALLDAGWVVGDLGCGTGQVTRRLAPFVQRVIGVDASPAMLEAAHAVAMPNVEYRNGQLETLPIADGELDVALLFLVLAYVIDPARVLREAGRALKPGGRLVLLDMTTHADDGLRDTMGHLWPGFAADQVTGWLDAAGFANVQAIALPVDPHARGPALFASRAVKPS